MASKTRSQMSRMERSMASKGAHSTERSIASKGAHSASMHGTFSQSCPGFTAGGKGVIDSGQNDNKRALKKFFHRMKENMGIVERTEFSKTLCDAFENLDNYKLCLDRVNETACQVIQENAKFRRTEQKVDLAPPPDQDQNEMVAQCLKSGIFEEYKNQKAQVALYEKQAVEHREYIRRARRALHNIRTFVQHDYWIIGIQRTELDNLRCEMDFAKAELKNVKEPQFLELKSKLYNDAVQAFEGKLKEVTKLMDAVPKNKETHVADIIELANCTRVYHEKIAKLLEGT